MQRAQDVVGVVNGSSYVDCYVSTDVSEVAAILKNLGYNIKPEVAIPRIPQTEDEYVKSKELPRTLLLRCKKTELEIRCADLLSPDIVKKHGDIGFYPMSKFTMAVRGNSVERELNSILAALDAERQNVAVVNDRYTRTFVHLYNPYK